MILSNFSTKRAAFFSDIESIKPLALRGTDIEQNLTIIVKDIKSFLSYVSVVHTREPITVDITELQPLGSIVASETLEYGAFIETTKLNDRLTFYFQATTFVNKVPLNFNDIGLLGAKNTYRPFDSTDQSAVNSMITADISTIRAFSDEHFKFKRYRGLVAFERAIVHKRGYTIALPDKGLLITIIASRHSDKGNSYIGIMYSED